MQKTRIRSCRLAVERLEDRLVPATFLVNSPAQITAALRQVQPGDTLLMADDGNWNNAAIHFDANGTMSQPITLQAQTPGALILTGSSQLYLAGSYLVVDGLTFANGFVNADGAVTFRETSSALANHCRLTNTAISNYSPADAQTKTEYVDLYGSYNEIDHCYFEGKTNLGPTVLIWVTAQQPNFARIDLNYFAYRPDLGFNGGESIRIGDGAASGNPSNTTVESNYFEQCDGDPEIISSKSGGNDFRNNTFVDSTGALSLRQGNGSTVEGNFFFGDNLPNTGGVRVTGDDQRVYNNYFQDLGGSGFYSALTLIAGDSAYPQVHRAQVVFNTFVNDAVNLNIGQVHSGSHLPPVDCQIANNVVLNFAGPTGPSLVRVGVTPVNMLYQGNIMFGAPVGLSNPGIQEVDPLLAVADDGLYRPDPAGPVIGAAQGTYSYVTVDMDGQPRPDDGSKDVGADQVSDVLPTQFPLGPGNVGPSWLLSPAPRMMAVPGSHKASVASIVGFGPDRSGPEIALAMVRPEAFPTSVGGPGSAPARATDIAVLAAPAQWSFFDGSALPRHAQRPGVGDVTEDEKLGSDWSAY